MKKKLVSVLLALVMIIGVTALAMLGVGAEEATAATHSDHCVCGGGRNGRGDHVCGEALTGWTAFSEDLLILADEENCRYNLPAGSYYLPGDMTLTDKEINILPDTEVTFCLNGFKLTANKRVFRVNGVLNITDCYANGNGRITGEAANAPVFYGYSGGHINLYGGILTAKTGVTRNWGGVGALATDEGSAAAKGSSSMTMYGGAIDASKLTIVKNSSGSHGNGGAVVLMGDTVDLDGDDIKETAYPATFIQYGGTIKGAKSVANNGGAIYGNSLDTIKILGGTVTAGSAAVGDGVAKASGSGQLVVGGNCKIEDLYLRAGQTFTTENLTGSVGLSTAENNFAVLATVSETEAACFTSNMLANHELTYTDGNLAFASYHADHCVCGGNLDSQAAIAAHGECATVETWMPLTAAIMDDVYNNSAIPENNILGVSNEDEDGKGSGAFNRFLDDYDTGHYYLTEDISMGFPIDIHTNDDITICLNGYTLSCTNGTNPTFRVWGKLTICDCTGEGFVTGKAKGSSTNGYGAVLAMRNDFADADTGTVVNLYGGTLKAVDNNYSTVGGTVGVGFKGTNPAVFNIYGGTITGGTASTGGNIYIHAGSTSKTDPSKSVVNMYGGAVTNGKVKTTQTSKTETVDNADGTTTDVTTYSAVAASNRGGNIFVSHGQFNMYGGSVTGGSTSTEAPSTEVAALPGYGEDITLYATSSNDAHILLDGAVEIGQITIHGNSGYAADLGENFSVDAPIELECQLSAGGAIFTGASWANKKDFVASDPENYQVTVESGGYVYIRPASELYQCVCGGVPTHEKMYHSCVDVGPWTELNTELLATFETTTNDGASYVIPAGEYYLGADLTIDKCLRILKDTKVTLDLNGYTLTDSAESAGTKLLRVIGLFRLTDTSYNAQAETYEDRFQGKIIATKEASASLVYIAATTGKMIIYGGNLMTSYTESATPTYAAVTASGELYLSDGTITGANLTSSKNGGSVTGFDDADVRVYGGKISGGCATRGGNIGAPSTKAIVRVYGGLIADGHAQLGGNIYCTGTLEVMGGTISGGEATAEGGNLYVNDLKMTSGTVSGGTSASYGGSMYITGTASISGGTVMNGVSTSTTRSGGNICQTGGTLTVSGEAVISGGQAREGGNISCRGGGTINIEGGTIEGGQASNHGGNIVTFNTLNISGGVIRNGSAVLRGGNISTYGNTGNITITGGQILDGILLGNGETAAADLYGANISMLSVVNKPLTLTITGGTIGGFGEGCVEGVTSVHVQSSGDEITTTVGGTAVIDELRLGTGRMLQIAEGGFSEGASIGITRFELTGVFAPNAAADYSAYFHGTKEGTSVEAVATETGYDLVLVSSIPYWAFDASNNPVGPAKTIADAMALEGATFVRLVSDYTTDEVVEGDLHLDLYGYDLTGLTVNGNLYAVDYKGHDYEEGVLGKLISFTGTVQNVYTSDREVHSGVRTYVALANEDGSYSFHRVSVSISHVSLKADADALGFKATVKGDAQVLAAITGFGFNMGVEGGNMRSFKLEGNPTDGVFTLRLKGIMAANGGEMTVIGQPVIFFGEDSVTGSEKKTSMKETVEAVEAAVEKDPNAYTEAQITTVQKLIAAYESGMTDWNIDAIKAWAPATEDETTTA